jgi:excisionase family DNA binding protein
MFAPAELGRMLHLDAKTITQWAVAGRLEAVRTPGGHRRFPLAVVLAFLRDAGFSEDAAKSALRALA